MILVPESGFKYKEPSSANAKNGYQYSRKPSKKINTVLFNIFRRKAEWFNCWSFSNEKLIALPTAKRNEGNTRSVGVNPCQSACSNGSKGVAPLPGLFTIIMKQTVSPRNTSSARKREAGLIV